MAQKNFGENLFSEFQSSLSQAMESSRKNFQAITEANQQAVRGWQALAQRQSEMVSQFLQDNAGASYSEAGSTEGKFAAGAEAINSAYQRSIANTQELAELASKCTKEAADVINKRAAACIKELNAKAASNAPGSGDADDEE